MPPSLWLKLLLLQASKCYLGVCVCLYKTPAGQCPKQPFIPIHCSGGVFSPCAQVTVGCVSLRKKTTNSQTNTSFCSAPVSSALGYVDQLLDAARVSESLCILHVFAGDLVQGATDGCHGLVWQQGGVPPRETVDQVPHRVLP